MTSMEFVKAIRVVSKINIGCATIAHCMLSASGAGDPSLNPGLSMKISNGIAKDGIRIRNVATFLSVSHIAVSK